MRTFLASMAILLTTAVWLVHGVGGPARGVQQETVTVTGTVMEPGGAPVAGARVELIRDGRTSHSTTTTIERGPSLTSTGAAAASLAA